MCFIAIFGNITNSNGFLPSNADRGDYITRELAFFLAYSILSSDDNVHWNRIKYAWSENTENGAFTDASDISFAYRYAVQQLFQHGIVAGNSSGEVRPSDIITRAEIATLLFRAITPSGDLVSAQVDPYHPDLVGGLDEIFIGAADTIINAYGSQSFRFTPVDSVGYGFSVPSEFSHWVYSIINIGEETFFLLLHDNYEDNPDVTKLTHNLDYTRTVIVTVEGEPEQPFDLTITRDVLRMPSNGDAVYQIIFPCGTEHLLIFDELAERFGLANARSISQSAREHATNQDNGISRRIGPLAIPAIPKAIQALTVVAAVVVVAYHIITDDTEIIPNIEFPALPQVDISGMLSQPPRHNIRVESLRPTWVAATAAQVGEMLEQEARRHPVFKCIEAARAMANILEKHRKNGELLEIRFIERHSDIILSVSKGDLMVSTNNLHQGVLFNGLVRCNIHPQGLPELQWIADFEGSGIRTVTRTPIPTPRPTPK